MLKSLQGIKPARDIQERPESSLEKLLKEEENMRKEYAGRVDGDWGKNHNNIYLPLYRSLSSTLPDYAKQDLQALLVAKSNNNYREKEAQVLGMYTGVLLHVLTERAEKEGKKAIYTFDLSGNQFDYLFCFAKRAGEVTVKKVKGKRTCSYLASYDGKAEKLVLEGNEGNLAAYLAGSYGGKVGTLVTKDNERDYAASEAGSHNGNVGTLVITNNKGDRAADGAGSYGGKVGTLIIHKNKGDFAASGAGSYGGQIETIALYNPGRKAGINAEAKRIIKGREALKLYQQWEKELHL